MPTILGVPLPTSSTITVTQATSPEFLLALINTLIWLLMSLLLYIQILENRRIGAHLARQLENKRRVHEEMISKAREGNCLRERRLEVIREGDGIEERAEGFEIVPDGRPVLRNGVLVEEDLRKAMDEDIPETSENGSFETPEDEILDRRDGDLREAMVDEFLDRHEESDIEVPAEDGYSGDDDGLKMVSVPARRLPDREENPFRRW